MQVRIDPLGTLVGHYAGTQPNAPALLIGSHLDGVRDAGRYDGPLGILLGIECVAALHAQERRLPFAIDVVAFGDDEGSRFPASTFCSRAVTGTLDPTTLAVTDAAGITVASALAEWNLDIAHVQHAARAPGSLLAYLETHIEHGPVLEAEALPVGSVSAIAAQQRFARHFNGRAGHAGTTSMALRRDALSAAAEWPSSVSHAQAAAIWSPPSVSCRSHPAPPTWCQAVWTARWTCAPAAMQAAMPPCNRSNTHSRRSPPIATSPSRRCRHWPPAQAPRR